MIQEKDVTMIIPHLGNSPETEYALENCLESLKDFKGEVIVVHNGRNDCKHGSACSMHLDYQGQCRATNAVVAVTNTPWIMVSNDDMIYQEGWFERLTDFSWFGEKEPLCVSPMLVEPRDGAPTFYKYFCGGAGGDFDKIKWIDFAKNWHVATPGKWRNGFNLPFLIRRDLWDIVGGYDINYDPWGSNSDSDLEYKIKLAGVQPYQNMNSIVYHFSQTSGTFNPEFRSYWERNWAYFIQKWGFPRTDNGIWEASFEIPNEGRLFRPKWEGKYAK